MCVIVLGAGILIGGLNFLRSSGKSYVLPVAFGYAEDDTIQIHIGIPQHVLRDDPPRENARGAPLWRKWYEEHFRLFDESEKPVTLRKLGASPLLIDAPGDVQFALCADLGKGAQYTCHFFPFRGEPGRYEYSFTAPSEAQEGSCVFVFAGNEAS
ncbi:MAG: hypothetical protein JSU63_16740 [Phycisphaerales bacterium]|nr:MAG: hypothetical protein JSU63_16740 [Phycisphaerales bacterium]